MAIEWPNAPALDELFVVSPKAAFTWKGNRWQRNFVPVPRLDLLDPNSIMINETGPCVLTGINFAANSVVRWDGTDTAATFVSATELNMPIPVSSTPGSVQVAVVNGVTVGNSLPFSYIAPDPPILDALVPDNGPTNSSTIAVSIQGQNFTNPSTVTWNGATLASTFVTTTELRVTAPLSFWNDTVKVRVTTPYGATGEKDFRYVYPTHPPGARPPLLEAVTPNQIYKHQGSVHTMRVTGQYFAAGTRVLLNGIIYPRSVCVFVNAGALDWTLDIGSLSQGSCSIQLETPPYYGTNPNLNFYISN